MAIVIPAGGQVPYDEPMELPPATPAEQAELEAILIANHWHQWKYTGRYLWSRNANGTEKTKAITQITVGMLNARRNNVLGAWPMPGEYVSGQWPPSLPANCVSVQQYPT